MTTKIDDDFEHYFNATARLNTENAELRAEVERLRTALVRADSMLSLLRHRGGIRWGGPLPESWEVDQVIGELRRLASDKD
jgi:hypothetical protein